jgi:hypothetical protein
MAEKVTITEKVSCDSKCMAKYRDKDGTFKGGNGEASCQTMFSECCSGVSDPAALCASIAKKSDKA